MPFRTGLGFDSHEFEEGKPLVIGGVEIDFPYGLKGHSDGDVLIHAITDAILGALGEPDIGELFSDRDERWRGAPSELFLREAVKRMRSRGYELVNLDCVIIADKPKIAPYKEDIRKRLSEILGVPANRISLKGKRREGFCEVDGMACMCTVLLVSRDED
ncbi:2-C-methyl-D-erythritol 2,4-cyclodiphosphate synthase [Hydrogenivirga sp.]